MIWNCLLDRLEIALQAVRCKRKERSNFEVSWSFSIGYTSYTLGAKGFETPHQIQNGIYKTLGICLTNPHYKRTRRWQVILFDIATIVFKHFIPEDFCGYEYCIHFSKIDKPHHFVPQHRDCHDISHQYAIHLGTWEGASLVTYDNECNVLQTFSQSRRLVKFDGRLPHEVKVSSNFSGERYSVIAFQLWHSQKKIPDPFSLPEEIKLF